MILGIVYASSVYGVADVIKYYGLPWLEVSHWCKRVIFLNINCSDPRLYYTVIMITYLHHTDPTLPHYRDNEWNFQRGAAATIDRNFLGWQGRFFLHDVAHYHVIHHVGIFSHRTFKDPPASFYFFAFRKFFPKMPFCKNHFYYTRPLVLLFRVDPDERVRLLPVDHGPEATQHLKAFIGDHYAYSDENMFKALWNSYNKCQFVENDGKYSSLP
jgi:hypothetical protein